VLATGGDHTPDLNRVRADRKIGEYGNALNLTRRPVHAGGHVDGEYGTLSGVHLLDDPGLPLPYLSREPCPEKRVDDKVGPAELRVKVFCGDEPNLQVLEYLQVGRWVSLVLFLRGHNRNVYAGAV
jgi:hypothetical protein